MSIIFFLSRCAQHFVPTCASGFVDLLPYLLVLVLVLFLQRCCLDFTAALVVGER
jgi:hypothetical protein